MIDACVDCLRPNAALLQKQSTELDTVRGSTVNHIRLFGERIVLHLAEQHVLVDTDRVTVSAALPIRRDYINVVSRQAERFRQLGDSFCLNAVIICH